MPNWCNNIVTIEHKNKTAIDRVEKAFKAGNLCKEFIPVPEELINTSSPNRTNAKEMLEKYGHEDWYSFQVSNWGTKWDVGGDNYAFDPERISDKEISLTFDSAWSPPTGLYNVLLEQGYNVIAYYYEPGCAFAGKFTADGDECYDLSGNYESVREEIPGDLDEMFNISASMKEEHDELENLMGGSDE